MFSWWKPKQKASKLSPETAAKMLYDEVVAEGVASAIKSKSIFNLDNINSLSPTIRTKLSVKIAAYHKAALLLVLLHDAQKDELSEKILRSYETLIFGAMPTDIGIQIMLGTKSKMLELNNLLNSQDPQLTWAMEWLQEVGVEETSPIYLTLLCKHWLRLMGDIGEYLSIIKPNVAPYST